MRRETEIKRLSRVQKQALIESQSDGELLTVYDADGRACGERPRAVVHVQGLYHHVCHLWTVGIWDDVPGLWLQQRHFDRPLYPGGLDLSATGHIAPGETPQTAMLREAREECGLMLLPNDMISAGSYRQQYARGEVADMVFVALSDFAAAHDTAHDLPARRMDGSARTVAHESLCCLHQSEWKGVKPLLE